MGHTRARLLPVLSLPDTPLTTTIPDLTEPGPHPIEACYLYIVKFVSCDNHF